MDYNRKIQRNNIRSSYVDKTVETGYKETRHFIYDLIEDGFYDFLDISEITYELLYQYIDERAIFRFGKDFIFRPNQKESIAYIIMSFFYKKDNFVLQAPTGSGKSITALLVADVLSYYFGLTGYILVSDLGLLKQYNNDIDKHFSDFAILSGQQNYTCDINNMPYSLGYCALLGLTSYQQKSMLTCYEECPYIVARKKAISSNVTLMTYQCWLMQRNTVANSMPYGFYPFTQREFVICDEAHKLAEIIQTQFAPTISKDDINRINNYMIGINSCSPFIINKSIGIFKSLVKKIFEENNNTKLLNYLVEYCDSIDEILGCCKDLKKIVGNDTKNLSKDIKNLLRNYEWLLEYLGTLKYFVSMMSFLGADKFVKNPQSDDILTLNCLDERYLITEHFHKRAGNCLFMSATIGEPNNYIKSISAENCMFLDLPSCFDFTKSPIYYINKFKLSYDKKNENLPYVLSLIEYIVKNKCNQRGIIQTGSYEFAKYVYDNINDEIKDRFLIYNNSTDKAKYLEEYIESSDKILIGPSLIEGIDLKDELCRFIIIMKIPYPSLGDKFIAKKFETDKEWYAWKTVNAILQGVGRGVRTPNDWCETFIIDGTFDNLLMNYRNLIPINFISRIRNITKN